MAPGWSLTLSVIIVRKERDNFKMFSRFENLFVHYMPLSARTGHWYKSGEMRMKVSEVIQFADQIS